MTSLVSIEQVKTALNIVSSDDDARLDMLIPAASAAIVNHLKGRADELLGLDTGGELPTGVEVPAEIVQATIYMVGVFYRNPDGDPDEAFSNGVLPAPVIALLNPLRDPTLA